MKWLNLYEPVYGSRKFLYISWEKCVNFHFKAENSVPLIRFKRPMLASAVACWWVRRRFSKSMAGNRAKPLCRQSSKCGCEQNVTDRRIGVMIVWSEDGQLARGITGGKTERSNNGNPPPMLGVRGSAFCVTPPVILSFTIAISCLIECNNEMSDDDDVEFESSNFCSFNISASNAAISFLYTRFCTSTRYWSSRRSSVTNRLVLHSIFNPMLWMTGSFITPIVCVCGFRLKDIRNNGNKIVIRFWRFFLTH